MTARLFIAAAHKSSGKTTVAAFMAVCPLIDTIKIKGRGQKNLDDFVAWVQATFPQITHIQVVTPNPVWWTAPRVARVSSGIRARRPSSAVICREVGIRNGGGR